MSAATFATQTAALFVDAYRELNARKLFWITLGLSLLVVVALACLGINEKGLTLLFWEFPFDIFNTGVLDRAAFYKVIFLSFGFKVWLTWAATILALLSTAGLIPEFVSGGSIELTLSKPVSRLRLFLTKYLTGLTFVALQVSIFTLGAFLVIGIRGGSWQTGLFWAIPLVVLFFSYLFCITVLVGLVTRSATGALLITGLFWISIFTVHTTEAAILLPAEIRYETAAALHRTQIDSREKQIAEMEKSPPSAPSDAPPTTPAPATPESAATNAAGKAASPSAGLPATPGTPADASTAPWKGMDQLAAEKTPAGQLEKAKRELAEYKSKLEDVEEGLKTRRYYHDWVYAVKTVLPKTSETIEVLSRLMFKGDEFDKLEDEAPRGRNGGMRERVGMVSVSEMTVAKEAEKTIRARPLLWVLGTSIAFEATLLGAACIIFCRRDF